jgi:hydrogenase small subunit
MEAGSLYAALVERGMSRRSFLKFSAAMAAALALPASYASRIARAVETAPRIPVIWLRGQSCGGNTQAVLRSIDPSVSSMLLDVLSVEYDASTLAVAGPDADLARTAAMERYPDGYIAVLEGSVPTGAGGAYCLVGGRPLAEIAREVSDGALATIALGSCAFDGGIAAASGGQTGAGGVRGLVGNGKLVSLPGCPMNVVNVSATIVHYLAAGDLPPADMMGRPLFAYGNLVHNQCERRPHFEFGEFALTWGDEGAQKGWCLYKLGCKGPETMANCPTARYGDEISWNVRAGDGCVGCTTPRFWDSMFPAYKRLGSPVPFLPNLTIDQVGLGMVAAIGGVAVLHGAGMTVREHRRTVAERNAEAAAAKRHATAEARLAEAAGAAEAAEATGPAETTETTDQADAAATSATTGTKEAAETTETTEKNEATETGATSEPAPTTEPAATSETPEPDETRGLGTMAANGDSPRPKEPGAESSAPPEAS